MIAQIFDPTNQIGTLVLASGSQFELYKAWLATQPLSYHTKRNYLAQIRQFLAFVRRQSFVERDAVTIAADVRNSLVAEYCAFLRASLGSSLRTINQAQTAINHFYRFLGLGPSTVERLKAPETLPRILTRQESLALREALEKCASPKNRAVVMLFWNTGIRLGECAALKIGDVFLADTDSKVIVSSSKYGKQRELPVSEPLLVALTEWRASLSKRYSDLPNRPLFPNFKGNAISTAGLDLIVRKVGIRARLIVSAQILRDSYLTDLAHRSNNALLVGKFSGCGQLASTKKYFQLAETYPAS